MNLFPYRGPKGPPESFLNDVAALMLCGLGLAAGGIGLLLWWLV